MPTALAPRKPIDRGDVESWSKLRVREKIARVRWFFYANPWILWVATGSIVTLVLEHNDTTFPAIGGFFTGLFGLLQAGFELLVSLFTPAPTGGSK